MSVRAKFKCESVEPQPDGSGGTVRLGPVTSGSSENESFYKYTPSGELVLGTVNQAAYDQFAVGKEYFLTIEEAEPAAAPAPVDPPSDPPKAA